MRKFGCNTEYNTKDHWNSEEIYSQYKVIAINVNPIVTKVALNNSIIMINIFSTDFVRKVY